MNITKTVDLPPDVNDGNSMLRTVWTLLSISTLVVVARIGVKCRSARRIFYDDGLIVLALGFGYVHAITITQAHKAGLGRHMVYLTEQELSDTIRFGFFSLAWGFLSPMMGRLSFCVFLLWVSGTDSRVKKWPIYLFMTLQLVVNIVSVIVAYAQCGTQLSVFWTPSRWAENLSICENPLLQSYYGYFSGSFNTMTDVFLTVLPAVIVWRARLTVSARIGLSFLLCLSAVAMTASIVKTYESKDLSEISDYTYDLVPYVIWISIELNVVINAASIPILRPLFSRRTLTRLVHGRAISRQGDNSRSDQLLFEMSKPRMRVEDQLLSSHSSHEDMLVPSQGKGEEGGITRTIEVSVTHSPNNITFIHAALVGLPID